MVPRRTLWRRGAVWLVVLAPLFFLTYGQVNQFTAGRAGVESLVFGWETQIPFLPWTIVPYWSIDLLYGLSLFVCTSRRELTRHAWRLVAASLLACAGFLLFPLKFSFVRPQSEGLFGWLFQQLELFDLPYNQAPSLHIMLAWLLWLRFWPHLRGVWRPVMSAWFLLIAASVLTTWQHHFIDVLTGLAAGVVISYAIPINSNWRWRPASGKGRRLMLRYAAAALICLITGFSALAYAWLLWPGMALGAIALAYAGLGSGALQKNANGNISPSSRLLLFPYRLGARLSMCWFMRRLAPVTEIAPGMFVGGYPLRSVSQGAVLDVTAEFSRNRHTAGRGYVCEPMLDLVAPDAEQLERAVMALTQLQAQYGSVLVHCALGLSRSALVGAAWLLACGVAASPRQSVELLHCRRPQIVLSPSFLQVLEQWHQQRTKNV
ncbi:PAP2 superfamily protein [Enterobacillus tribolii]|uniref:PAP2 superfamily protein n=2 Tax=Enterobacillus tribolii TaxID=1487935 RepID=A0A370R4Z1_9GAMM|nr:phosphatase PAP2 family protein [Enterobacillus tribolii]RDK97476.1 PAP2 superfamily protein [Enterobacillus tribolii]